MASKGTEHRLEEEEVATGDEEDTGAHVTPVVNLEEVAVSSGEEDEDVILELKSKLYRHDTLWKERGTGTVKLLKNRESGKFRLVMRQSQTLKICANHYVLPTISLRDHAGNDKSCLWHAANFVDGEVKVEKFCIKFESMENCKIFREKIQEIAKSQQKKEKSKDALTAAAGLLEKLSVKEEKSSEKEAEPEKNEEVDTNVEEQVKEEPPNTVA